MRLVKKGTVASLTIFRRLDGYPVAPIARAGGLFGQSCPSATEPNSASLWAFSFPHCSRSRRRPLEQTMGQADTDRFRHVANATALLVLLPLSLVLTATTNRAVGRLLNSQAPSLDWIATAAIPSFLIIAGIYALLGNRCLLRFPSPGILMRRPVLGLSAAWLSVWLGGCVVSAIITGHWTIYARGLPLVAAFVIFGPLGEELLFRGLIFSYARVLWPSSATTAIAVSTVAFSLHHVSLHTAPRELVFAQVLFTIPMGIVFALLRERTGSIWPGLLTHIATNLPSAI